jgi:hypothetical protein
MQRSNINIVATTCCCFFSITRLVKTNFRIAVRAVLETGVVKHVKILFLLSLL